MADGKILITGATGFVGRHTVQALLGAGRRLRLIVRDPTKLDQGASDRYGRDRAEQMVLGDLAQAPLEAALDGVETVVHLAGLPGGRFDEAAFMAANATATARLCEAARQAGVERFIHMSSIMAVTGNSTPDVVHDDTPPEPHTAYGRSKLASEAPVAELGRDILAVSLRSPLVIGPDSSGNWRRLMRLAALKLPLPFGSVRARRSYIAADALAEAVALLCAAGSGPTLSGAYLVADPQPLTLPEVIAALRAGMGRAPGLLALPVAPMNGAGRMIGASAAVDSLFGRLELDPIRFIERFGFRPSLPIREAIRQCGTTFLEGRIER